MVDGGSRYTFSDILHAARTQQSFEYVFWIEVLFELIAFKITRISGSLFVVLVVCLISGLGAAGLFIAVPVVTPPGTLGHVVQSAAGKFTDY
jgi:hypothetical protein